jgi:hypothetical protein
MVMVLLQHFPMFRESDKDCSTPDAPPDDEKLIPFREKFDCLSRDSSKMVGDFFIRNLADYLWIIRLQILFVFI